MSKRDAALEALARAGARKEAILQDPNASNESKEEVLRPRRRELLYNEDAAPFLQEADALGLTLGSINDLWGGGQAITWTPQFNMKDLCQLLARHINEPYLINNRHALYRAAGTHKCKGLLPLCMAQFQGLENKEHWAGEVRKEAELLEKKAKYPRDRAIELAEGSWEFYLAALGGCIANFITKTDMDAVTCLLVDADIPAKPRNFLGLLVGKRVGRWKDVSQELEAAIQSITT